MSHETAYNYLKETIKLSRNELRQLPIGCYEPIAKAMQRYADRENDELLRKVSELEEALKSIDNLPDESWEWKDQKVRIKAVISKAVTP